MNCPFELMKCWVLQGMALSGIRHIDFILLFVHNTVNKKGIRHLKQQSLDATKWLHWNNKYTHPHIHTREQ